MTDSMKNNDVKESEIKEKKNMGESVKGMAKSIGSKANLVVKKSSESLEKSKEAVFRNGFAALSSREIMSYYA